MPIAGRRPQGSDKRPDPLAEAAEPFLRFHHSKELRARTLAVLATLEGAGDATAHRDALAAVVVDLTHAGLDAYFLEPLTRAQPGFMVQQSANLGMAGARQVMGSVIRNIIGRMDDPQLRSVCGSIRGFMK